jgi:hypothetical protein
MQREAEFLTTEGTEYTEKSGRLIAGLVGRQDAVAAGLKGGHSRGRRNPRLTLTHQG